MTERHPWIDSKGEHWYISDAGGLFYSGPLRDTPDHRLAEFTKHLAAKADALQAERDEAREEIVGLRSDYEDLAEVSHKEQDEITRLTAELAELRDLCGTAHALIDGFVYEGGFPPEGSDEDKAMGAIMRDLDNAHMAECRGEVETLSGKEK